MSGCENCNKCDNIITFNNNKFEYNESLSYPHAAIMSLTDDCTNRCPYCFVKFGTKRMTLDTAR
jgi:lipoate synthase